MGFHANPRATTSSPILFRPQWSTGVHRVTDVSPLVIPQMIPQPTIIENGTDPRSSGELWAAAQDIIPNPGV
jgi:hypothetical protein